MEQCAACCVMLKHKSCKTNGVFGGSCHIVSKAGRTDNYPGESFVPFPPKRKQNPPIFCCFSQICEPGAEQPKTCCGRFFLAQSALLSFATMLNPPTLHQQSYPPSKKFFHSTFSAHLQASFLLGETLQEHPRMGLCIAREVERFVFRPGITPRARYTALVFLNQTQLSHHPDFGGAFQILSLNMSVKRNL